MCCDTHDVRKLSIQIPGATSRAPTPTRRRHVAMAGRERKLKAGDIVEAPLIAVASFARAKEVARCGAGNSNQLNDFFAESDIISYLVKYFLHCSLLERPAGKSS